MGAIYVVPLKAYNAGKGGGKWVEVDDDPDSIWDEIKKVLKKSPVKREEEWAVHDYEDFPNMGEYPDVEDMASVAEALDDFPAAAVAHALDYEDASWVKEYLEEHFAGQWSDKEDWAYNWLEDQGVLRDAPDELKRYFDYASYARDMFMSDMTSVPDGEGGIFAFYNY